ncbi:DUF2913 family protein [Photobacterium leiognathi]|uniref:DUF2913 family protein n=1 Tax=Photobacterium leiognathi TaxID=553611 RepID=UPI002981CB2E|nr:DUF2913 family protein [Photobacterium leiognathi]
MVNTKTEEHFFNFTQNALINLYISISGEKSFIKKEKRNSLIKKYCERNIKLSIHKPIKQHIKKIILHCKKGNDVEDRLNMIVADYLKSVHRASMNDVDRLMKMLTFIETKCGIKSKLNHEDDSADSESDVIYILAEQIENGFDDSGKQISPIILCIEHENIEINLKAVIEELGLFKAERKIEKEKQNSIIVTYTIHPYYLKNTTATNKPLNKVE